MYSLKSRVFSSVFEVIGLYIGDVWSGSFTKFVLMHICLLYTSDSRWNLWL